MDKLRSGTPSLQEQLKNPQFRESYLADHFGGVDVDVTYNPDDPDLTKRQTHGVNIESVRKTSTDWIVMSADVPEVSVTIKPDHILQTDDPSSVRVIERFPKFDKGTKERTIVEIPVMQISRRTI